MITEKQIHDKAKTYLSTSEITDKKYIKFAEEDFVAGAAWAVGQMKGSNDALRAVISHLEAENSALRAENERLLTAIKAVERIASRGDVNAQPLLAPILITIKMALEK